MQNPWWRTIFMCGLVTAAAAASGCSGGKTSGTPTTSDAGPSDTASAADTLASDGTVAVDSEGASGGDAAGTDTSTASADAGGGTSGGTSPVPTGSFKLETVAKGKFNRVYGIHGTSPSNIFITGDSNAYHWDGKAWSKSTVRGNRALFVADEHTVWGVSDKPGPVWLSIDGEATHCFANGDKCSTEGLVNYPLRDIHGVSASKIWAVGGYGLLVSLTDPAARKWKVVKSGTKGTFNAVWATSAQDVWAVGVDVVHGDGTTFAKVDTGITDLKGGLKDVWASGPNDVWAVGKWAVIHFDGTKWSKRPSIGAATSVYGFGPHDVWFFGPASAKARHWNGKVVTEFDPVHSTQQVWGLSRKDFWVVGANAKISFNGEVLHYLE